MLIGAVIGIVVHVKKTKMKSLGERVKNSRKKVMPSVYVVDDDVTEQGTKEGTKEFDATDCNQDEKWTKGRRKMGGSTKAKASTYVVYTI